MILRRGDYVSSLSAAAPYLFVPSLRVISRVSWFQMLFPGLFPLPFGASTIRILRKHRMV